MRSDDRAVRISHDDAGLRALAAAGTGYVIDPWTRRWHAASCPRVARLSTATPKWFAASRAAAEDYMRRRMADHATAKPIEPCAVCSPDGVVDRRTRPSTPTTPALAPESVLEITRFERGFTLRSAVRATFDPEPNTAADSVRAQLRALIAELAPRPGEVLAASLSGTLPPSADVENFLLYNIIDGSAGRAMRRGVRFELGVGGATDFIYRYACEPAGAPFRHWEAAEQIASWLDVPVPPGPAERLLARTWLALRRSDVTLPGAWADAEPFALRLTVRMPATVSVVAPDRLKQLVDGIVCAFQRHEAGLEAASRIGAVLGMTPNDVLAQLDDGPRAVLGSADRPIGLWRTGVRWNPDDTRLVAAEVLFEPSPAAHWTLSGCLRKVTRRGQPATPY